MEYSASHVCGTDRSGRITMVGALPDFHWLTLVAAVPCIALGMTIHAVLKLCISMLSFWIEDANPFQWLYDKLILVVGTIFPVEIFPAALQPVLKLTPIYTVCYGACEADCGFQCGGNIWKFCWRRCCTWRLAV